MDIRIVGTGSAVPDKVLTNDMLAQMVDTDDEWIWQRTGIRERRIVEGETGRDLSRDAATAALAAAEKQGI
ncbi:MAG TPA: 3-oxoacyl-ACP synthase, partial [Coriobacteriia bacterium]|nr:3-oxoacyl-ACP synthase [Coriobacteriia bacterium]